MCGQQNGVAGSGRRGSGSIVGNPELIAQVLINAAVSMGRRNTQLELTLHGKQKLRPLARLDRPGCQDEQDEHANGAKRKGQYLRPPSANLSLAATRMFNAKNRKTN
jgi:hypothetical protein